MILFKCTCIGHRYMWTGPYVAPFFFSINFFSYKQHFATFYVSLYDIHTQCIYNKYHQTVVSIHAGFLTYHVRNPAWILYIRFGSHIVEDVEVPQYLFILLPLTLPNFGSVVSKAINKWLPNIVSFLFEKNSTRVQVQVT